MKGSVIVALFLAFVGLAGGGASGADFFSVDQVSNCLVRVSSGTSVVTPLSYLGRDVYDMDLACAGGYLYVLNSHQGYTVELLQVDPATFEVLSAATVTVDGQPIEYAEGLASLDGQLLIAYWATNPYWSSAIGDLSSSGAITPLYDYHLLSERADFDGLTSLFNGHLLAVDSEAPGYDTYRIIELVLPPDPAYIVLGEQYSANYPNDLEMLDNGDLWAVDYINHNLLRLAMDGHILEMRSYDPTYALLGLVESGCGGTVAVGACCFANGSCLATGESYCQTEHGIYQGDGTTCEPNPCQPTPVSTTTWGRIKATYH